MVKFEVNECMWGYSSVVEHSTADREVPGSNPGAPFFNFKFFIILFDLLKYFEKSITDFLTISCPLLVFFQDIQEISTKEFFRVKTRVMYRFSEQQILFGFFATGVIF